MSLDHFSPKTANIALLTMVSPVVTTMAWSLGLRTQLIHREPERLGIIPSWALSNAPEISTPRRSVQESGRESTKTIGIQILARNCDSQLVPIDCLNSVGEFMTSARLYYRGAAANAALPSCGDLRKALAGKEDVRAHQLREQIVIRDQCHYAAFRSVMRAGASI